MLAVVHNLAAFNANRQYNINEKKLSKSTEKLSSGYKINRAADDAAGLSISEKMRRQIRGLNQGIKNTEDGVSLCQVADGALNEVDNIIHRLKELSVHAANAVPSEDDRQAIEDEYSELLAEIDDIADKAEFNGIPLFQGKDVEVGDPGQTFGDVTFDQVELGFADYSLANGPLGNGSSASTLQFAASTTATSNLDGVNWNLVYGSGSTSKPSIKVSLTDAAGAVTQTAEVSLSNMTVSNYNYDTSTNTWSRTLSYSSGDISFDINQSVKLNDKTGTDQYYSLSYEIVNTGTQDMTYDFMYHCDTAYNNNDQCEGYYINGSRVSASTLYTTDSTYLNQGNANVVSGVPTSFSICDLENALQFTEKIEIDASDTPDTLSIGNFSSIKDWSYYSSLGSNLGNNMIGNDLGFSAIWSNRTLTAGASESHGIKQGIAATDSDANVANLPRTSNSDRLTRHESENSLFIQEGANAEEGFYLVIGEMNTEILGLKGTGCSTQDDAVAALSQVDEAIKIVNAIRSKIGAQQNRMEFTINNESNYSENLTSAESTVRDTDMAEEMVTYTKQSILAQVGQAMIAQTNQRHGDVLSLLQ